MTGESPILAVSDLVAGYDPGVAIVKGASLRVAEREIVVVLGPNGAGKSTLIKAIAGLVPISSGEVRLDGQEITRLAAHLMVRHGLAFVPQTENVFALMSIEDNLQLAGAILAPRLKAERIEATYALFPDLARQRRLAAGRLSGGQRQMLAVARALMVSPRLLMLDEPSAGLSPKLVEIVFAKLTDIRRSGVTIVLVEQNARAALETADFGYVLETGSIVHSGKAADLIHDPKVVASYLGGKAGA